MRIDSVGQIPIQTDFGEMLKNLEVGDVVKGRVLEALKGNVTIRTAAGQVFTAALLAEVEPQKGAMVELLINNIADGKAFAEVRENAGKAPDSNAKLSELLLKLNIPLNENNLETAKLMVKYNLPLDRETLTAAVNLQKSLASLGENDGEGLAGLLLSGMDIDNTPVDVLNRIVLTSETEVKKLISEQEQGKAGSSVNIDSLVQPGEQETDSNAAKLQALNTNIKGEEEKAIFDALKSALKELGDKEMKLTLETHEQPQKTGSAGSNRDGTDFDGYKTENANNKSTVLADKMEQLLSKLGIEKNSDTAKLIGNIANTLASLDGKELEHVVFLLSKDMEVTPKNLSALADNIKNTGKVSELLDKLQQHIDKHDRQDLREVKEDIQKLFMRPEQLEDKEAVKERIKDVVRLGEKLENALSKGGINDMDIKNTLTNLKDNIDFIKSVNEYSNYLQIPVMINDKNTTTDIYVFREGKKGKKIDPNNATILIALDLKYIGHIESLVNVINKSVNVTFRLEDKGIGSLINGKSEELRNSLEARGYTLNPIKIIELEQSFNILTLDKVMSDSSIDRLHFDMRV